MAEVEQEVVPESTETEGAPKITKKATIFEGEAQVENVQISKKHSLLRKATETKTSVPKKYLTRFLMKSSSISTAYGHLATSFYANKAEDVQKKDYAITHQALVPMLKKLGLEVTETETEQIFKMADFDQSKDCQFNEFLTVVGLALIKLSKEWTCETNENHEAIKVAFTALETLWAGLLECLPEDAADKDHLTTDVWQRAFSASGSPESNALFKARLEELDKDGNSSIDLAEFLATTIQWVGADEE